ncbi:MAG: helix-turn-helix domain-containing protein [Myxococcales bacterium]|nr:helix-turn-helix domain-containing protein [Myxococcales bacterium]
MPERRLEGRFTSQAKRTLNPLAHQSAQGNRPQLIAISGGGGGCGRSTIAAELARLALRKGKRVLAVDADLDHPSLMVRFDFESSEPSGRLSGVLPTAFWSAEGDTDRRRPDVTALGLTGSGTRYRAPLSGRAVIDVLRELDYDLIIIDTASTLDSLSLDLTVFADVPVILCSTEPVSLAAATRFVRATVFTAMRAVAGTPGLQSAVADTEDALFPRWSLQDLFDAAERHGTTDLVNEALHRFEPLLLLSQTRESAERELGQVIALAWWYLTGVRPRVVGAIDHDPRRWFHLRQGQLTPTLGSESGSGVQFEEVARRILDPSETLREQPRKRLPGTPAGLFLLGMDPNAPAPEVRLMYRRLWEGVRRDHVGTQRLLFPALRERLIADLETANRELQVWLTERPTTQVPAVPSRPRAQPGQSIRDARTARNVSERELSLRTKIGLKALKAIEDFDTRELPRATYLRQYLKEIALALDIDPEPLLDTYLTAYAESQHERVLLRTTQTGDR